MTLPIADKPTNRCGTAFRAANSGVIVQVPKDTVRVISGEGAASQIAEQAAKFRSSAARVMTLIADAIS
jgi:hypothetical protein